MGPILISAPDIPDGQLVFNEAETRQILKFFWPSLAGQIDEMTIDNEARRLAQTALVSAIEASCAFNIVERVFKGGLLRPYAGINPLITKLVREFVHYSWQHAKEDDLKDAVIYDGVRNAIAHQLRTRIEALKEGASLQRFGSFYVASGGSHRVCF